MVLKNKPDLADGTFKFARQKRKIYLCSLKIEGVPDERNHGGDASS